MSDDSLQWICPNITNIQVDRNPLMVEVVRCTNITESDSYASYATNVTCSSVAYSGQLNVTQMYVNTYLNAYNYFQTGELQLASFTDTTIVGEN